jgi:hypothetical protein
VGVNLEPAVFDPVQFERELTAFDTLLKSRTELSERADIQPFFESSKVAFREAKDDEGRTPSLPFAPRKGMLTFQLIRCL